MNFSSLGVFKKNMAYWIKSNDVQTCFEYPHVVEINIDF